MGPRRTYHHYDTLFTLSKKRKLPLDPGNVKEVPPSLLEGCCFLIVPQEPTDLQQPSRKERYYTYNQNRCTKNWTVTQRQTSLPGLVYSCRHSRNLPVLLNTRIWAGPLAVRSPFVHWKRKGCILFFTFDIRSKVVVAQDGLKFYNYHVSTAFRILRLQIWFFNSCLPLCIHISVSFCPRT